MSDSRVARSCGSKTTSFPPSALRLPPICRGAVGGGAPAGTSRPLVLVPSATGAPSVEDGRTGHFSDMVNPRSLPGWLRFVLALVVGALAWVIAAALNISGDWAAVFIGFVIGAVFIAWELAATRDQ